MTANERLIGRFSIGAAKFFFGKLTYLRYEENGRVKELLWPFELPEKPTGDEIEAVAAVLYAKSKGVSDEGHEVIDFPAAIELLRRDGLDRFADSLVKVFSW